MKIDPDQLSTGAMYHWMVGLITPRPIAWVSTRSKTGVDNLAPYSFFNGVSANPPCLMFCPVNDDQGQPKDSLVNVRDTGVFAVHIVTQSFAAKMNATSQMVAPDIDEFEVAGLEKKNCDKIDVARVGGAAACLECELLQSIQLGHGPGGGNLVIGQIVAIDVDETCLENGRLDTSRIDTIGRMGGSEYSRTTDRFSLRRPDATKRR